MKILLILFCFLLIGCSPLKRDVTFKLDDKYYQKGTYLDITSSEFNKLIDNKESFAVFIYQPLCNTSYEFSLLLDEFINKYNISLYKIEYSDIKDTEMAKYIKYYPSLVIYYQGEVVSYLDTNSDKDINYYKDINAFEDWFSKYIILNNNNDDIISNNDIEEDNYLEIDMNKYDLTYNKDKINIYLFWGNGCPHCEEEMKFLESIQDEYGKYFKLNKFEVWYDYDNEELLYKFANLMGDNVKGVPYTIIGNESFKGFNENIKDKIKNAIVNQYKDSYDVYFSNIEE